MSRRWDFSSSVCHVADWVYLMSNHPGHELQTCPEYLRTHSALCKYSHITSSLNMQWDDNSPSTVSKCNALLKDNRHNWRTETLGEVVCQAANGFAYKAVAYKAAESTCSVARECPAQRWKGLLKTVQRADQQLLMKNLLVWNAGPVPAVSFQVQLIVEMRWICSYAL